MAENTKIEWCDHTFNPWVGCTKISPACDHCYAESWAKRSGQVAWGGERKRTSAANWRLPVKWNIQAVVMQSAWARGIDLCGGESACIAAGYIKPVRPKVFSASLADVFDNMVDPQWRADLFKLILATPNLDWLLLTKRVGNVSGMVPLQWNAPPGSFPTNADGPVPTNDGWPGHVWIGATICNQSEADRDIPKLLAVPAAKRFLSMEPLLGSVEIHSAYLNKGPSDDMSIDWVIVGGESGPNARPMHPDWVRSLRDQCEVAGVPFFFKQWGEWAPHQTIPGGDEGGDIRRGHVRYLVGDGREPDGHFRRGDAAVARVGKKYAGRLFDGRVWNGVPA